MLVNTRVSGLVSRMPPPATEGDPRVSACTQVGTVALSLSTCMLQLQRYVLFCSVLFCSVLFCSAQIFGVQQLSRRVIHVTCSWRHACLGCVARRLRARLGGGLFVVRSPWHTFAAVNGHNIRKTMRSMHAFNSILTTHISLTGQRHSCTVRGGSLTQPRGLSSWDSLLLWEHFDLGGSPSFRMHTNCTSKASELQYFTVDIIIFVCWHVVVSL